MLCPSKEYVYLLLLGSWHRQVLQNNSAPQYSGINVRGFHQDHPSLLCMLWAKDSEIIKCLPEALKCSYICNQKLPWKWRLSKPWACFPGPSSGLSIWWASLCLEEICLNKYFSRYSSCSSVEGWVQIICFAVSRIRDWGNFLNFLNEISLIENLG